MSLIKYDPYIFAFCLWNIVLYYLAAVTDLAFKRCIFVLFCNKMIKKINKTYYLRSHTAKDINTSLILSYCKSNCFHLF